MKNSRGMARRSALALACAALLTGVRPAAAEAQSVTVLTSGGLDSLLQKRGGRALILNLWATWCTPCREEFPDLAAVVTEYPDIDAAALSVDYPDEIDAKIRPFVKELKLPFPVFVSGFARQEELINRLAPAWNGGLPATFLFTPEGRRDTFYVGRQSRGRFQSAFDRARQLSRRGK